MKKPVLHILVPVKIIAFTNQERKTALATIPKLSGIKAASFVT